MRIVTRTVSLQVVALSDVLNGYLLLWSLKEKEMGKKRSYYNYKN